MIDDNTPNDPVEERREEKGERRTGERRAHERYTPSDAIRVDRRQGERRHESN